MLRSFIIAAGGHLALVLALLILSAVRPPLKLPKTQVRVRMITRTAPVSTPAPERTTVRMTPPPVAPKPTPRATPKPTATPKPKKAVQKKELIKKTKKEIVKITPTPTPTPRPTPKVRATPRPTPIATIKPTATPRPTPRATPKAAAKPTPLPRVPDHLIRKPEAPQRAVSAKGAFNELGAAYSQQAIYLIQLNFKPSYARPGTTAVVQFRIHRDGRIVNPKIKQSTGRADMDEYVLQALRKTGKLPPFYDTFPKAYIDVEVVFSFDRN